MDTTKIKAIQGILGVDQDGAWGRLSQGALDAATGPTGSGNGQIEHHGKASSFADPADVALFVKWKQVWIDRGLSDADATKKAFAYGDNAVGFWGDSTAEGTGPSCALPPDDMVERWGSVDAARNKLVDVENDTAAITCVVKDTMPWKKNITNGAIIDLNPDSVRALGWEPPIMNTVTWKWV